MPAAGTGGVQPLNVQILITTRGARAAASAMGTVTKATKSMTRGLGAGVITTRTLGDAMRMSASLLKYTVAGAFMKAGTAAVQAFRNFELSMARIKGLTGMSSDAVANLSKEVLKLAQESTRGPEELADALYFVTSSGIRDATVAMEVLRTSAKAAAAGLGETKQVVDALTSAMNAYGPTNLSAAKAGDILVAAVREGKAEADKFAPAFSKVLPVAAAFGASFEDVAAAMAALTRSGMTAGTAGIYVRQVLSQLLKPSKQGAEALAAVGTSAEDIRKNVQEKGLFPALQELSQRIGGIENAETFARVFGNVRALTAVLQLVGPAAAENAEIFERLGNSAGDLDDAFDAYSTTLDKKFNQAFANSRVALIELGRGLKPIITLLLDISTILAKAGSALAGLEVFGVPVGRFFIGFASILTIGIVAIAAVMKSTSALIRLFSNLHITLAGTTYMYDATTKTMYKYTGAAVSAAAATRSAALGAAGWTAMNSKLATSLAMVQKANKFLLIATVALTIIGSIWSAWKGKTDKAKASTEDFTKSLGNMNELLDETVKYGESTLLFNVETNVKTAKLEQSMNRAKEQILEQSPQFFDTIKQSFTTLGVESGQLYVVALMNSMFSGMTTDAKATLKALFEREFGLDPSDWENMMVPEVTGDLIADSLVYSALFAARNANKEAASKIKGTTFKDFNDALNNAFVIQLDGSRVLADTDLEGSLNQFGQSFTDIIQETGGNVAPLIVALNEMQEAGTLNASTLDNTLGKALKGLTGDLDLADESSGNLAVMFSRTENAGKLLSIIMKSTNLDAVNAQAVFYDLKNQMAAIPPGVNKAEASYKIFSDTLGKYKTAVTETDKEKEKAIRNLEAEQLALKGTIEEYENATNAMKAYETAMRGLQGMQLTQEEALRDLMDSYQGLGDAVAKGNNFNIGTEGGRKAREELQSSAEAVQEYAFALAAAGDTEGAGEAFSKGILQIIDVARQAGGATGGDMAAVLLSQMGFTEENFKGALLASQDAVSDESVNTGKNVTSGIARGIQQGQPQMAQALVSALKAVVITAQSAMEQKSPSKKTARELGKPMAQGVAAGWSKQMQSSGFRSGMAKDLENAVGAAYKAGGRKGASKFFKDFLDKKKDVETPAQDFVKATIGRMKDIIGSLSDYINSQLNFRKAQADLAKLINMQRGLDDRRKKAAREQQYAETRRGRGGGAEVTSYEQAELDQLQLDFERVSRDYAMGRAAYTELVDAEIALYEARAAASEISSDVIDAQNGFIDATVEVENKNLTLAAATVNVLSAYQDVQEAAAELYMNHKELAQVYDSLAKATGIASGKIQVGSSDLLNLGGQVQKFGGFVSTVGGYVSTLGNASGTTKIEFDKNLYGPTGVFANIVKVGGDVNALTKSIGADFTNMAKGLLSPDSELQKNLNSLGGAMWKAIQTGAEEALDASVLNLKVSVNAVVDKGGSGSVSWTVTPPTPTGNIGRDYSSQGSMPNNLPYNRYWTDKGWSRTPPQQAAQVGPRAVGGPVAANKPYIVGEKGPEMFLPKVSGTIITNNALERYTRTRSTQMDTQAAGASNNISVTVNNPVPAAAEDSITRRMKVLANSGLFG